MNELANSQRKTIQYYSNLLEKEKNPIKQYLLKREIKASEKDLNQLMKPKKLKL